MGQLSSIVVLAATAGCHFGGDGCKLYADAGLYIRLRDARTGMNPTAMAVATITSGSYVERDTSHTAPNEQVVITGLVEKQGVYDVLIRAPGYRDWTATGIGIPSDGCHVQTQTIDATLSPM